MKKLDLFGKPMNGLYSRSVKGGIKTLLILCLSFIGSYYTYIHFRDSNQQYTMGGVKSIESTIPMNVDIVVYDRTCDTLSYHFDSVNSVVPSSIHIDKTPYFPTLSPFSQKESCRIHGHADLHPGDGDFHITPNDKQYSINGQHRHLAKADRQTSFYYQITDLYFGRDVRSNAHLLKEFHNRNEVNASSHTTLDIKLFPTDVENVFVYSASKYTLQKEGDSSSKAYTGLYLRYSLQPTAMSTSTNQLPLFYQSVLCICSFGSLYSLLSFVCNLFYKSKIISKRDLLV